MDETIERQFELLATALEAHTGFNGAMIRLADVLCERLEQLEERMNWLELGSLSEVQSWPLTTS